MKTEYPRTQIKVTLKCEVSFFKCDKCEVNLFMVEPNKMKHD